MLICSFRRLFEIILEGIIVLHFTFGILSLEKFEKYLNVRLGMHRISEFDRYSFLESLVRCAFFREGRRTHFR